MKESNLIPGLNLRTTFYGHSDVIHRIAWSKDGKKIASPSRDRTIIIWNCKKKKLDKILKGHSDWLNCVAWSPDGKFLVAGDESGKIWVWNLKKEILIQILKGHKGRIECIDWAPNGEIVGSASSDRSIIFWSVKDWTKAKIILDHQEWVNAISWSQNGEYVATGAEDNTVKIWKSDSYSLLFTLSENQNWITDLAWSPDGKYLAHTTGKLVKVWNPIKGKLEVILEGHKGRVGSVSFSYDGNLLVSKSKDHTFRLWDTKSWETIIEVEETTIDEVNPEAKIAFHPSKPILASLGDNDKVVRIWDYSPTVLRKELTSLPSVHFSNAKVVLIGKSGTGKSCLARALMGKPFVPQESTHGMSVFLFNTENIK